MSKTGRPTKYTDELIEKAKSYITDYVKYEDVIPSIASLSLVLGVTRTTLYEWEKEHKDFSYILADIKAEQEKVLISKGLSGEFNSNITKLVLGKHGYHDKQDVGLTGGVNVIIEGNDAKL